MPTTTYGATRTDSGYQRLVVTTMTTLFVISLLLVTINLLGGFVFLMGRAEYIHENRELLAAAGQQRLCTITELVLSRDSFSVYYYVNDLDNDIDNDLDSSLSHQKQTTYDEVIHSQLVYSHSIEHYSPVGLVKPCWSQNFHYARVVIWQRPGLTKAAKSYLSMSQYYPDFFCESITFVFFVCFIFHMNPKLTRAVFY